MPISVHEIAPGITVFINRDQKTKVDGPVEPVEVVQVDKWRISMIKPSPVSKPDQFEIAIPGIESKTHYSLVRMEGKAFADVIFQLIVEKLKNSNDPVTTMEDVYRLVTNYQIEQKGPSDPNAEEFKNSFD